MERILLLNEKNYPDAFSGIEVTPPPGESKQEYVEKRIISAINHYNPKLNITRIEYLAIETEFSCYKKGNSSGVIVEENDIKPSLESIYTSNGNYVYTVGNRCLCRKILMYVFMSGAIEGSRTSFVSQTVFPTLLDYTKDYLPSPSYSIANHKFCYINIVGKKITATMVLRHLASLYAADMDYIEVFGNNSLIVNQIPKDLKTFLENFSSDFTANYNSSTNIYDDDNYKIDFSKKIFTWKAISKGKLVSTSSTTVDFKGSSEKFYWIETLPMALFAYKQGYTVDYTEYSLFISTYKPKFKKTSDKFARCEVLLEYMKKFFI